MSTCVATVTDGRVECPYLASGSVDVETCYRCPRLRAFYDEESGTRAECIVPPRILTRLIPQLGPRRKA